MRVCLCACVYVGCECARVWGGGGGGGGRGGVFGCDSFFFFHAYRLFYLSYTVTRSSAKLRACAILGELPVTR